MLAMPHGSCANQPASPSTTTPPAQHTHKPTHQRTCTSGAANCSASVFAITSSGCPIIMTFVLGFMSRSASTASSVAALPSLVFRPSSFWRLGSTCGALCQGG